MEFNPNHKILDKHPIVNTDLIQFIRHGRIKVQRDIAKLEGKKVHFVDGTSKEYDLIVFLKVTNAISPC